MPSNPTANLTQLQCAACGQHFGCGASSAAIDAPPCWCREVKLGEDVLTELQRQFAGCLCQNCLAMFADQPAAKISNNAAITKAHDALKTLGRT